MRNLVEASGPLAELIALPARPASDEELWLHRCEYVEDIRIASAELGDDAGRRSRSELIPSALKRAVIPGGGT